MQSNGGKKNHEICFHFLPVHLFSFFLFVTSVFSVFKSDSTFICRSPSVSRIRAKMLYATSKDRFRRELEGIHYEIQATDPTEMDLEVIKERAH